MRNLIFSSNLIFKKFLNFYSYKIFLYSSNNNLYCYLFSFFKFNIVFSLSSITLFLKNYIILNFGKSLNSNVFKFLGKCFSFYILGLKIYNIRFFIIKYSKNLKYFFCFFKKYII